MRLRVLARQLLREWGGRAKLILGLARLFLVRASLSQAPVLPATVGVKFEVAHGLDHTHVVAPAEDAARQLHVAWECGSLVGSWL